MCSGVSRPRLCRIWVSALGPPGPAPALQAPPSRPRPALQAPSPALAAPTRRCSLQGPCSGLRGGWEPCLPPRGLSGPSGRLPRTSGWEAPRSSSSRTPDGSHSQKCLVFSTVSRAPRSSPDPPRLCHRECHSQFFLKQRGFQKPSLCFLKKRTSRERVPPPRVQRCASPVPRGSALGGNTHSSSTSRRTPSILHAERPRMALPHFPRAHHPSASEAGRLLPGRPSDCRSLGH